MTARASFRNSSTILFVQPGFSSCTIGGTTGFSTFALAAHHVIHRRALYLPGTLRQSPSHSQTGYVGANPPCQAAIESPTVLVYFPSPDSFFPQFRVPVVDQRDHSVRLPWLVSENKSLAVRADVVSANDGSAHPGFKQRPHRTNRETRPGALYLCGHHFVVQGQIEKLLSITSPAGKIPAARGHLPLSHWPGKRYYIHF